MSGFWKFALNNFRMFIRDTQMVFWSILFPVILMSLLGIAFGSIDNVTFSVSVIDYDGSAGSEMFIDSLKEVKSLDIETKYDLSEARKEMKDGNLDLIIIIPDGFQEDLFASYDQGGSSGNISFIPFQTFPDSNGSQTMVGLNYTAVDPINITILYNDANQDKSFSALAIVEKVIGGVNKQLTGRSDVITINPQKTTGADLEFIDYIAPGILAMSIMQTGIFGMSMFIVTAREKGILKRLQATPVSSAYILASRILVNLVVVGLQTVILLSIAVFGFGVQIVGSLVLLALMVIMGSLVFIMLGFIISSVSKTSESAESFSNVISMPMMFLGDVFIPISVLPGYIQVISKAMPLTYLSDTFRKIMLHDSSLGDIWINIVILVAFGIIMFIGAVKMFRWEK